MITMLGYCKSGRSKDGPLHLYETQSITSDCRGTKLLCGIYVKRYQTTTWHHIYAPNPHERHCGKCERFKVLRMFEGEVFNAE
jgi:hypothetical protein